MVYYLDLLILRANARLNKLPFFYIFLGAIQVHTLDPLENFNPKIPIRVDEDIGDENVQDDAESDYENEEFLYEEDDWFIYPEDLSNEDKPDDEDFIL